MGHPPRWVWPRQNGQLSKAWEERGAPPSPILLSLLYGGHRFCSPQASCALSPQRAAAATLPF